MVAESDIQGLLLGASTFVVFLNLFVLGYVAMFRPLKSELAKSRPLTQWATRALIWIVAYQAITVAYSTVVSLLRNSYSLPVLMDAAPSYVPWMIVIHYCVDGFGSVLPALLLYGVAWNLMRYDEIISYKLEAYEAMAYQKNRSG